ncbi:MAG: putative addiction module antidote protein [Bryobacterales bacterium]|nr:putative addiction module antidote protein [Bryobacterales bacterium]
MDLGTGSIAFVTETVLGGRDKGSQHWGIQRARRLAKEMEAIMTEKFTKRDAAEHLHTVEDARLYVQACAEEDPSDGRLIRAALNDVGFAGNMESLARKAGLSRESLYKALAPDGNPTFATVMRITRAIGLQLRIS